MDYKSYNFVTININTITNENKLNALRSFLRTQEIDIALLQEVENDQLSLPGYNVVCNVDHARRGTAIAIKQHIRFSHVEKSLDGRVIALRVGDTTLCNCYAHSGTNMRNEREHLMNHTLAYYLRHLTTHTILAGDFNCVLRRADATGSNYSPALRATIQQLQLHDIWEKLQPQDPGYTYISHNSASRLDRIYVDSSLRSQLRTAQTHVCCFTDHKAVTLRICLPSLGRELGRGFWSLRPHLLSNDNIDDFQRQWQYWTRQRRGYASWMSWWMQYAKPKIKSFFRWKSKIAYDVFHREYQRLYSQLRGAYDSYLADPTALPRINAIKGKMLGLQREFTQTFMRTNETYIAGEELSAFQLGERKRKRTTIDELRDENNQVINTSEAIEQHLFQYYQRLYSEETPEGGNRNDERFTCNRVVPNDDEPNSRCMNEITTAEIFSSIRSSARKKSPGPDGIPNEFYSRVFDIIHRELNLILNEALNGIFPTDFVQGVIVLVKKRGGDATAKAYRPISLLNSDFKILSRILKCRLESVTQTHRILGDSQKCANSPRNIFQATLSLKDRIAQIKQRKQYAKLISFDLENAFDRVRHSFLFDTMNSLGINREFIGLLNQISNLSSSRLMVNGHLSAPIEIQRSVRQGDPISSLLFVLYLHPLLQNLERVHGCSLVIAYADDISIIVTSAEAIGEIHELFRCYGQVSGAKLNVNKTKSIDIGDTTRAFNVHWLQTENTVKILGIIFANSVRLMVKLNWDAQVSRFAQHIWLHSLRNLAIHQKVSLLNTYITSRIWYVSSTLPPSSIHTGKITATIGRFLWNRIPTRIPLQQLSRLREKGGLKLQLPSLKCKALLINRHLKEIDSIPFYKPWILSENRGQPIPADLPDLRTICQEYNQLPLQLQEQPTSDDIHRFFVGKTEIPKVERQHPTHRWPRIWKNIGSARLNAIQKSALYMLVNEKTDHRKLLFVIQRADGENCLHCNTAIETIQHKFCACPRVATAWAYLQQRIANIMPGRRRLNFNDLLRPALENIGRTLRDTILKTFISYISFINNVNNVVDIQALDFFLNCET